ncbi:MAG: hypothetical protein ACI4IM_03665 [Acutalibacteraceae bacterium]
MDKEKVKFKSNVNSIKIRYTVIVTVGEDKKEMKGKARLFLSDSIHD